MRDDLDEKKWTHFLLLFLLPLLFVYNACAPPPTSNATGSTRCWNVTGQSGFDRTICRHDLPDGTICYTTTGEGALSCIRDVPEARDVPVEKAQ